MKQSQTPIFVQQTKPPVRIGFFGAIWWTCKMFCYFWVCYFTLLFLLFGFTAIAIVLFT